MKQYNLRDVQKELENKGFSCKRIKGSHEMWSNGKITIALPRVNLKCVIANKIMSQVSQSY